MSKYLDEYKKLSYQALDTDDDEEFNKITDKMDEVTKKFDASDWDTLIRDTPCVEGKIKFAKQKAKYLEEHTAEK